MDYKTKIVGIGELAQDFLEEKILIVFNENAPAELAEISVRHTIAPLEQDVKVGDVVLFGENEYVVTAVGDEANSTLKSMGHCTLSFNGYDKPMLPGHIELSGECIPSPKIGDVFEIIFTW